MPETLSQLTISFTSDCQMHSAGAFLVRQRLEKFGRFVHSEPDPDDAAIEASPRWIVYLASEAKAKELRRAARVPGVTSRVVLKHVAASTLGVSQGSGGEPQDVGEGVSRAGPGSPPNALGSPSSDLLRVEVAKIDRIMNLVGELVIGRSMVAQALADMSGDAVEGGVEDLLSDANGFLERTLTELQAAVLKIRMVPVEHVFKRFPRLVRDLAHSRGKQVELDIQGGMTELDKSIVDALGEPLLHLVRNAIDHGIETPEERSASGKAPKALLTISAFYEGNHAHVVVEDDGRGIDVARVAQRAVTQGILEPSELDSLAPEEILNTIYHPGFSTADAISDVSGRGVGMDIVRESIANLKGVIELETAPGRGTRFLIRLPLTLAILRAVLVEVGDQTFAVPLTSVLEIIRLVPEQARTVLGHGVLHWRNQVVPLVSLKEVLDVPSSKAEDDRGAFVLLVGEAERRVGLTAKVSDKLGGVEIKPFMIQQGIDPQELLLDLAVEMDNERREATSLLELAFQGDIPADLGELPDEPEAEDELAAEPPEEPRAAPVAAERIDVVEAPQGPAMEAHTESETADAAPEPRRVEATIDDLQGFTIVVVDDEPLVTAVLKKELEAKGLCVYVATAPAAGAEIARMRVTNGENVLAVVDLKMPTSSGKSFYGGFELIRRLKRHDIDLPVLLMVESLSEKARTRARTLGVRRIVYKPALTKRDAVLYEADLRDLAETVRGQLRKLVEDRGEAVAASGTRSDVGRIDFLATMTRQLVAPGGTADVSRLVLQVAAQFLERGVLFVVKSDGARGLAGFGFCANAAERGEKVRKLSVEIGVTPAFAEAVSTGTTQRAREEDGLGGALAAVMEPGHRSEAVLIPVLYNRATLLLLYGDNGMSGKELGDLGGLELFMAQAGMALENKLLHRSVKVEQTEMVEHIGPG